MSKVYKKRVHGNEKMNLPCDFKKCPGSLHFTLLMSSSTLLTFSFQRLTTEQLPDNFFYWWERNTPLLEGEVAALFLCFYLLFVLADQFKLVFLPM